MYTTEEKESYTIVTINEPKLDESVASVIKDLFVKLTTKGATRCVVDLSRVKYTDSLGLGSLLIGNRLCSLGGGILVLAGLSGHIKKLFLISKLGSVLMHLPSVESASQRVLQLGHQER